jgi:hypothetical protein
MVFLRLLMLMLVAQTVVYVCVFHYIRAGQRERLAAEWPDHATERERAAFVEKRVATQMSRLRPWLAVAVYVVPIIWLIVYILVSNT